MRIVSNEQSVAYHNSETTLNDNNKKKNLKKYGLRLWLANNW